MMHSISRWRALELFLGKDACAGIGAVRLRVEQRPVASSWMENPSRLLKARASIESARPPASSHAGSLPTQLPPLMQATRVSSGMTSRAGEAEDTQAEGVQASSRKILEDHEAAHLVVGQAAVAGMAPIDPEGRLPISTQRNWNPRRMDRGGVFMWFRPVST